MRYNEMSYNFLTITYYGSHIAPLELVEVLPFIPLGAGAGPKLYQMKNNTFIVHFHF